LQLTVTVRGETVTVSVTLTESL